MAKSWDIQPKRKAPPAAPVTPERQSQAAAPRRAVEPMVRRAALQKPAPRPVGKPRPKPKPEPIKTTVVRRERIPQGRNREPLKDRRRRARRVMRMALGIFIVLVIAATIGALWLPAVRIQSVHASGSEQSDMEAIATASMQGTTYFIVPRDSIFFFPESAIRRDILAQHPDIAAVSISRSGFDSISIAGVPRESAFLWCGQAPDSATIGTTIVDLNASSTPTILPSCYDADSQGYVFAQAAAGDANSFRIYDEVRLVNGSPLGGRLQNASSLPAALQFVKTIKSLGVQVVSLALRSDEADLFTQGGTKITYVLGNEDSATKLAQSAFPTLNLNDGSLEYVDLRFTDKVYFKKKGETTSATTTAAQ